LRPKHAHPFFDLKKIGMLRHAAPFVQDVAMFKGQGSVTFLKKLRKDAQLLEKLSSEESRPHMSSTTL
jgi:hypothetical protein